MCFRRGDRCLILAVLLVAASATPVWAQVDGANIPSEFAGSLVATQENATGFGDNQVVTAGPVTKGSELDALYVTYDATDLWIGITGNLPNAAGDGQTIVLLIDAVSADNCNNFPTGCGTIPPTEACCMTDGTCAVMDPAACVAAGGTRLGPDTVCAGVDVIPPGGNGIDDACELPITPAVPNEFMTTASLPGLGGGHDSIVNLGPTVDGLGNPVPGTILEPGFYPERAIAINRFGGQTFIDSFNLVFDSQDCFVPPNCFDPILVNPDPFNLQDISVYMDTTNELGVDDNDVLTPDGAGPGTQGALAATAVKGLRIRVSRAFLSAFEAQMKIMVLLMAPDGTVSNQILPPLSEIDDPASPCSLVRPADQGTCLATGRADFEAQAGVQMATIDLTAPPSPAPSNPDGVTPIHADIPAAFLNANANSLVATQRIHTSFGNAIAGTITSTQAGSELDQLFVRTDAQFLQVGLSGNLEQNGNKLYLFVDADPLLGESVLDSNGLPTDGFNWLRTWTGRIFEPGFAPEHAYVINNGGGTMFLDHYELLTDTKTFLGQVIVGSGSGVVDDTDPAASNANGDQFALDNSNVLGVLGVGSMGGLGNPTTATTGLEAKISLFELGVLATPLDTLTTCPNIKVWAVVSGGDSGPTVPPFPRSFLSNQALPTYAPLSPNVGSDTDLAPFDFGAPDDMLPGGGEAAFTGLQFASVALQRPGNVDLSADCCVNLLDLPVFVDVLVGVNTDPMSRFLSDMNEDGSADGGDIGDFVAALVSQGVCP